LEKVIVTGGAGFVGSHLAEELANRGYYVVILDDLSTGRMENIADLIAKENIEFVQGNINDASLLQRLFRDAYYVFHLAAIPSVPRSTENPLASHQVNATGTLNVLLSARDSGVKKVVYASSSSVYGDTGTAAKREDMMPSPQSPYAVTKLTGEYYCQVFQEVYGLPSICLRYFNIYGAQQDPNCPYAAVIPIFIRRICQGNPPVIFGDGKQTRDFTFIKDATEANILAAESDASGVFNIGRGESVTINQLARLAIRLVGNNSVAPVYDKPRPGDIRHSLADISKSRILGYNPRYSLEEGLRETVRRSRGET